MTPDKEVLGRMYRHVPSSSRSNLSPGGEQCCCRFFLSSSGDFCHLCATVRAEIRFSLDKAFCFICMESSCPPTTIEALELLSNLHMSNIPNYAAAQAAPYMVAAARRVCQVGLDSRELASGRVERGELRVDLLGLEEEKHKFEERYNLLAGEKASLEERVVALDGSMECFSQ